MSNQDILEEMARRISILEDMVTAIPLLKKKFEIVNEAYVTITSTQNAWDISDVDIIHFDLPLGAQNLNGIANGYVGRMLYIHNATTGGDLSINHNSGSAVAGNKIVTPTGATITLGTRKSALLNYYTSPVTAEKFWLVVFNS